MATGDGSSGPENNGTSTPPAEPPSKPVPAAESADESEDDDDDEEPRLKYATLTKNVSPIFRNGDAASSFLVAGDKMIVGTHNGNIHVFSLPSFATLRTYHAHTASVSSISISPNPPPLVGFRGDSTPRPHAESTPERERSTTSSPAPKGKPQAAPVPNTPSNQIYIATSSIDGNVCIVNLIDPRDTQLRNFGRPVQAVALSPEYRSDRNYFSGGQAGSLILTNGGQSGRSANATTTGAAAAASGWLGSIGLGASTGTDKVLHSGEGIISTIKWSPSGRYVLWVNEQGIKIMRTNLKLESGQSGVEWKRMAHIDRPTRPGWEDMAGVWKARAEWFDRDNLESDDDAPLSTIITESANGASEAQGSKKTKIEEVLVGWGDAAWLIKVHPPSEGDEDKLGRAEVATIILFDDCIISGISLYTPSLLLVLAYMEKKGNHSATQNDEPGKKGRKSRHNALEPELRLIDINTKEEVDNDTLTVSRFETLSASDYHLAVLPPVRFPAALLSKGYLSSIGNVGSSLYTGVETVGQGVWDATMYGPRKLGANRIFSGAESVRSGTSGPDRVTPSTKERNFLTGWIPGFGSSTAQANDDVNQVATAQSMKIFIYSPYDCIVAVRRNLNDRMQWLVSMKKYQKAWELLDEHPEAAGAGSESAGTSSPPTPSKASSVAKSGSGLPPSVEQMRQQATLVEFFADSASMSSSRPDKVKERFSNVEKEKRRVGELWLQQVIDAEQWEDAAEVAAKVLNTTTRWEHYVYVFIKAGKYDDISPVVPTLELTPPLPSAVFEIILGHYVETDRARFKELLDQWPSDLFEISSVTTAIEDQLKSRSVPKGSQDWRSLTECLAKLFLADGRYNDALRCYIHLQDADTALSLMKEHHLIDAVSDDIPSFVLLRISSSQLKSATTAELDELSAEPIKVLVDEATHGVVEPDTVVPQLDKPTFKPFLYFYLRSLWRGEGAGDTPLAPRVGHSAVATALAADTGKQLVEPFADTALELFAAYDRALLMDFLQASTSYNFEKAVKLCEKKHYVEELVYLLSKTGQTKKALYLIIDELKDVSKAINFAKEQDDQGLWDDFLEYSMSRPRFISGLLAEVGTAIDPITLVKRIPSGLEIQGLKDGLKKMIREYDLQDSISTGVARVLSGEVAVGMETLRRGRRRGIKFEVMPHVQPKKPVAKDEEPTEKGAGVADVALPEKKDQDAEPGQCASCHRTFSQDEPGTLVGFACGHVYHVAHLLHGPDAEGDEQLLPRSAKANGEDEEPGDERISRSVGPKVTTARLLKDKIQSVGGCKICLESGRRESLVV